MKYIRSTDGTEIGQVVSETRILERVGRMARDLNGNWTVATIDSLSLFGLWPLVDEATDDTKPDGYGWAAEIQNDGPGLFVRRWAYDADRAADEEAQAAQDAIDEAAGEAERQARAAEKAAEAEARRIAADERAAAEAGNETERDQARQAITQLQDFIDDPAPNVAARVRNAKLQNRVLIRLIRDTY